MSDAERERLHDDVLQLLPWYHNGTLGELECARVEAHLARCPDCSDELARCRDLEDATAAEAEAGADWQPGERNLARVLQRIEADERPPSPGPAARQREARTRGWWTRTPRTARWALAAQAAAIAGLALLLFAPVDPDSARFETLTSSADSTGAAEGSRHLQVVFGEDVTEVELRSLVRGVGASIVAGPSGRGVYELALPQDASLALQLASLRADPKVRLAEPVVRGSAR